MRLREFDNVYEHSDHPAVQHLPLQMARTVSSARSLMKQDDYQHELTSQRLDNAINQIVKETAALFIPFAQRMAAQGEGRDVRNNLTSSNDAEDTEDTDCWTNDVPPLETLLRLARPLNRATTLIQCGRHQCLRVMFGSELLLHESRCVEQHSTWVPPGRRLAYLWEANTWHGIAGTYEVAGVILDVIGLPRDSSAVHTETFKGKLRCRCASWGYFNGCSFIGMVGANPASAIAALTVCPGAPCTRRT